MRVKKRALVVTNPKASRASITPEAIGALLEAAGIECVLDSSGDLVGARVLRGLADVDLIVLGGGDGTLNRAAEALVAAGKPLGILPLGTANDLAHTLSIPLDLAGAVQVITGGATRRIDLGRVNGKLFFNAASIGLSTRIASASGRSLKRRWGALSYVLTAARLALATRLFRVSIQGLEGTHRGWSAQVTVANGRRHGGGMTVHEQARLDDGVLHLYSLEIRHWWEWLLIVAVLRFGRVRWSDRAYTAVGSEFVVQTRRPRPVNTDGELTTWTPARFDVVPAALEVFVPDPA